MAILRRRSIFRGGPYRGVAWENSFSRADGLRGAPAKIPLFLQADLKLSTYKNWLWHLNRRKTSPLLSSPLPRLSSPSDSKGGASGGGGKGVTAALRRRRTGTVDPATVTREGGGSGDGETGVHPARTSPTWSIGHDLNGLEYLE
uniref:Uncharacterized protein n=1 Tax=Oryza glumipatula TaxID=40148 RepID=A0A0E0B9U9_9ORYZ